jgi:mRNA-degrading endonuclease RelE of RelBE toxin-antitoxin system
LSDQKGNARASSVVETGREKTVGFPRGCIWSRNFVKGYRARNTKETAERIQKLHPQVKREIKQGIREFLVTPLAGQTLQFELVGLRAYRVRTYRIMYRLYDEESCFDIIFVGPRRNVYEELRTLLLSEHGRN